MLTVNFKYRSDWTWHNFWNLLTINFKHKYFHNFIDWSGLYLQVYIPSRSAKRFKFTFFRLLGMHLQNSLTLVMIRSLIPHVEQPSNKFAQKNCPHLPWKPFRKMSLHTLWKETLCSCSIGKLCRCICSLNVCEEVRTKT